MSRMSTERMQEIMGECDKYQIRLANDPTVLGPKYLQDMIAMCRNYTNQAVVLLNEVRRSKMEIDFDLRRKEAAFDIAADELLAKNPIVRNLPNIKDRQSQINLMLKEEHRVIKSLQNDMLDLEHVEDFVKVRHRELKDTMREIQTQRGLLRDEHQTGSMYGDERPTAMGGSTALEDAYTPGAYAKPEGLDENEIEKMLKDGPGEAPVEATEATSMAQEGVVEVVEEELSASSPPPVTLTVGLKPPSTEEGEIRAFLDKEPSALAAASLPLPVEATVAAMAVDDDLFALIDSL